MADFYTSVELRLLIKNVETEAEARTRLAYFLAEAEVSDNRGPVEVRGVDIIAITKEDK